MHYASSRGLVVIVLILIFSIATSILVLLNNKKSLISRVFVMLTAASAVWSIVTTISFIITSDSLIRFTSNLSSGMTFVLMFMSFVFTEIFFRKHLRKWVMLALVPISIPLFALFSSNYTCGTIDNFNNCTGGPAYPWLIALVLLFLALIIDNCIVGLRSKSKLTIKQAKIILYGFASSIVLGLIAGYVLPSMGIVTFNDSYPILPVVFISFIFYAMARHGLFDIRPIIVRSFGYIVTLTVFASFYGVLVFGIASQLLNIKLGIWVQVSLSVITAAASLMFPLLKQFFDKITSRFFYKVKYDPQKVLASVNKLIISGNSTDVLLEHIARILREDIGVDGCTFYIRATPHSMVRLIGDGGFDQETLTQISNSILDAKLAQRVVAVKDTTQIDKKAKALLAKHKVELVAKISATTGRSEDVGVMLIGAKKNGDPFNGQDLEVIRIIVGELSVAIESALRFDEIQKFNETLQSKVDEVSSNYEEANRQMYAKNFELARINTTLTTLRAIDLITLQSGLTFETMAHDISKAILNSLSYSFVAIFSPSRLHEQSLDFQGWEVSEDRRDMDGLDGVFNKVSRLSMSIHGRWMDDKSRNLAIDLATMKSSIPYELQNDEEAVLKLLKEKLKVTSIYLTKLHARNDLVGVMIVGLNDPQPKVDDIELIERLGEPIGVALDNKLLFDENQRVLKRLSAANDKLKQMDETKDEFISMASHQLRTPLTSVKGYVSMVIEGDAGPLNEMQSKLLGQAFISSQRMVYLIADLLNVSRLRTGKFVIESVPVNLADMVEGEVQQLQETAKGRGLTLIYDKPSNFPSLMLDETKTRQVVMNFMDNAIYYTPQGGKIEVKLAETDKSVEFSVTDNGIGVSRHEQAHLFTKFFRAGNARKARPDGTGLGLFMAKKVIASQGGAITFKSKEGKGSTFGFTFAKSKIKPPTTK